MYRLVVSNRSPWRCASVKNYCAAAVVRPAAYNPLEQAQTKCTALSSLKRAPCLLLRTTHLCLSTSHTSRPFLLPCPLSFSGVDCSATTSSALTATAAQPALQPYDSRCQSAQPAHVWPVPGWRLGDDPGPGCFNCCAIHHMFRNCPLSDTSNFFHWYIQTYVPWLWASIKLRKEETTRAAPAGAPAAGAPVVVPAPRTNSRPPRSAFTFIDHPN